MKRCSSCVPVYILSPSGRLGSQLTRSTRWQRAASVTESSANYRLTAPHAAATCRACGNKKYSRAVSKGTVTWISRSGRRRSLDGFSHASRTRDNTSAGDKIQSRWTAKGPRVCTSAAESSTKWSSGVARGAGKMGWVHKKESKTGTQPPSMRKRRKRSARTQSLRLSEREIK